MRPAIGAPESQVAVEQTVELCNRGFKPKTNGADKGYHSEEFVTGIRALGIVPPHGLLKFVG